MAIVTNDKALVKEFIRINFINNLSSFPAWETAEDRFLRPIIGDDMYDMLTDIIADQDPTALDLEYLKKARAVVVPLAYLIELPLIHAQVTDAGLRVVSTENMIAAPRWAFNEVKDYLQRQGEHAIEGLLKFLYKNQDEFDPWTGSAEYTEANSLIFKTGEDFNKYFHLAQPQRMYWLFRPLIREVEAFYIASSIGEEFLDELKALAVPGDEEKKAIDLIKKAVAQLTIVKAIEKLSVMISEMGFTVKVLGAYSESVNSDVQDAPSSAVSILYESCQRSGDAYQLQLKEYLNANASAQLFNTYFDSSYYVPPATDPVDRNSSRKIIGF